MEPTALYATGDKRNVMHDCTVVLNDVFSTAYINLLLLLVVVVAAAAAVAEDNSSTVDYHQQ